MDISEYLRSFRFKKIDANYLSLYFFPNYSYCLITSKIILARIQNIKTNMYLSESYREILIGSLNSLVKGTGLFRTGGY